MLEYVHSAGKVSKVAIIGLENLASLAPPARKADTVVSRRLAYYRGLHDQVTKYLTVLSRGCVRSAQSALTVLGMVSYKPAVYASDVLGIHEVMKANNNCVLVI